MKVKYTIIFIILSICLIIQAAAAINFEYSSIYVSPEREVYSPGEQIQISADIMLLESGLYTFPCESYLQIYTDLDNPKWTYTVLVNGHGEEVISKKYPLTLTGWELNYPNGRNTVAVSCVLTGTIPNYSNGGDVVLFRTIQIDSNGYTSSGPNPLTAKIVNPNDIKSLQETVSAELSYFHDMIETQTNIGVDVTLAQEKYNLASQIANNSANKTYDEMLSDLTEARDLIKDGEGLLNENLLQQTVKESESILKEVDSFIEDLKNTHGMINDARVINIEVQVKDAQESLDTAITLNEERKYSKAQESANVSKSKASDALSYAKEIQSSVLNESILDTVAVPGFVILIIFGIIATGGYMFHRHSVAFDKLKE